MEYSEALPAMSTVILIQREVCFLQQVLLQRKRKRSCIGQQKPGHSVNTETNI